jgi:hypothetical protein
MNESRHGAVPGEDDGFGRRLRRNVGWKSTRNKQKQRHPRGNSAISKFHCGAPDLETQRDG